MKSTGIVRRTDCNGRISIPMEIRKTLNIPDNTPLELFVEDGRLIYQKYEPTAGAEAALAAINQPQ